MAASRLQLASRLQFSVQRSLQIHVDVAEMLLSEAYAQEILQACRTLATEDLIQLADAFEQASREQLAQRRTPGSRPRDLAHSEVRIRRPNGTPAGSRSVLAPPRPASAMPVEAPLAAQAAVPALRAPVSLSQLAHQVRDRLQAEATPDWWPAPAQGLAGA